MARITPIEGRNAPPLLRLANAAMRRVLGRESTPLKIIAHNPGFILPMLGVSRFVQGRTSLPPETRTLATQLVAELNGCAWCIDFGTYAGRRDGIAAAKLQDIAAYATSPHYTPAERAALTYAAAVTQVGARVADDVWEELRRHYSERQVVELTLAVAAENFYNRLNAPLEVEAQGFCALPVTHAGPDAHRRPSEPA